MSTVGPERDALLGKIRQYKWYHQISVAGDLQTESAFGGYPEIWSFILRGMGETDFAGMRVLDVACRDGLFSFEAERRGAREVIGIDNDLSVGATEFLIPFFRSKVRMYELNLYELTPDRFGLFDVILLFGVLYHLRYPFWGLRKVVDCLSDRGLLLIESGMLVDRRFEQHELLYCPVETSPYERTSCSFFNTAALSTTLRSFGCRLRDWQTLELDAELSQAPEQGEGKPAGGPPQVKRQFLRFEKDAQIEPEPWLAKYWNRTHDLHTRLGY
jgi:SAM-dependent methyltransferase